MMKNQGLTSFDVLTIMFSLGVVVAVSAPIVRTNFDSRNLEKAQIAASQMAKQLSAANSLKSQEKGRSIASVGVSSEENESGKLLGYVPGTASGEGGKDPWGRPYRFSFIQDAKGLPVQVAVWSVGPNGKDESGSMNVENPSDISSQIFQGDDLGSVAPVR
ncbi:MAG: hypothetical protein IT289_07975 [Oligoflexia bacterium]|nr:hypothetical protein [Oligoflexia bacterium]